MRRTYSSFISLSENGQPTLTPAACSGPSGPPGPDRYGDRQGPYDRRGPPPGGPGGYGRRYPDEWHPEDRYPAPDDRYGPPDDRYGGAADDRYGGRGARSPPRSRYTRTVPCRGPPKLPDMRV